MSRSKHLTLVGTFGFRILVRVRNSNKLSEVYDSSSSIAHTNAVVVVAFRPKTLVGASFVFQLGVAKGGVDFDASLGSSTKRIQHQHRRLAHRLLLPTLESSHHTSICLEDCPEYCLEPLNVALSQKKVWNSKAEIKCERSGKVVFVPILVALGV